MACLPSSTTSAVSVIIEKQHGFGNLLVEEEFCLVAILLFWFYISLMQ